MKKVSEVQDKLEKMGCHKKDVTELLIACNVLENDAPKNPCEVGKIYLRIPKSGELTRIFKVVGIVDDTHVRVASNFVCMGDNDWRHETKFNFTLTIKSKATLLEIK